jgi:hypothetical protein
VYDDSFGTQIEGAWGQGAEECKRKEVLGLLRELQNEELQILCYSPKIISIFKPWKVR